MNYKDLKITRVKTTPQNVREANEGLFKATMNLPQAAAHCGMSQKEMKLIFFEYLKYNKPDWDTFVTAYSNDQPQAIFDIIDETEGSY